MGITGDSGSGQNGVRSGRVRGTGTRQLLRVSRASAYVSLSVFLPPYSVAQKAKECGEEPGGFLAIEAAELKAKGKA